MKNLITEASPKQVDLPFVKIDSLKDYWMERIIHLDQVLEAGDLVVALLTKTSFSEDMEILDVRPKCQVIEIHEDDNARCAATYLLRNCMESLSIKDGDSKVMFDVVLFRSPSIAAAYVVPFYTHLLYGDDDERLRKLMEYSLRTSITYDIHSPKQKH